MQTALHICSLVAECTRELIGGVIVATEFFRKERAAYIVVKGEKGTNALGLVFHPSGFGAFCIPNSKIERPEKEKPWPFFELTGMRITKLEQVGLDRIIRLVVTSEEFTRSVILEAIGPNSNLWLLDESDKRLAVLRHREFAIGDAYQLSQTTKLNPFEISGEQLEQLLRDQNALSPLLVIEKQLIGFNKTLAREVFQRAGLPLSDSPTIDNDSLAKLALEIHRLAERFQNPETGYLYAFRSGNEVYPFKLASVTEEPEKFKTLSLAVMAMMSRKQSTTEEADDQKRIIEIVSKTVSKLEKRLEKVAVDITNAGEFEKNKKLAELLQINHGKIKRGMKSITVEDTFADDGSTIAIPLNSALTPKDNVEEYFRKYQKGREGLELLERRKEITEQELQEFRKIQAALEADFESASQRYSQEISSLLPREREQGKPETKQERLPYREHKLSTGLTIFIGRDGSDNDRTTFEYAKPHELWFHTQQCPGSHVVMKFPHKTFQPSKREIEETASIAAFHSKAKNDRLVPVIYTERRYVRKPRKAKPGLVMVDREKSIMVPPKKEG